MMLNEERSCIPSVPVCAERGAAASMIKAADKINLNLKLIIDKCVLVFKHAKILIKLIWCSTKVLF